MQHAKTEDVAQGSVNTLFNQLHFFSIKGDIVKIGSPVF